MNHPPSTVAIVGAGPTGASLAGILSKAVTEILLFHSPEVTEKHCAGGIPARTLDEFPWLNELTFPRREICRITLLSPNGVSCDLELTRPIGIVARASFDEGLRQRARRSGVRILNERVRSLKRDGRGWIIRTDISEHRAGFLVGADGATSLVRRALSDRLPASSLSLCAGYYFTPPDEERITIGFLERRAAYAWIIPRPGMSSAGIVAPLAGSDRNTLLGELRSWLERSFPGFAFDYSKPYSALVPTYTKREGCICGAGWALAGDAAGVADPLTREGIYFSIKSAEILATALLNGHPEDYGRLLTTFLEKRHRAALFLRRYLRMLFFAERAVRLIRKNVFARRAVEQFFSGSLSYGILSRDMLTALFRQLRLYHTDPVAH